MKFISASLLCFVLFAALPAAGQAPAAAARKWFPSTLPERYASGFYFYWGYNRASFSTTNLHFTGPNYDFTLYDVTARDRPTKFTLDDYFHPAKIWIPQYAYRLGYHLNPRWAVSFGLDHMKYVADADQKVRMSGVVTEAASQKYAGTYLNQEVSLQEDLLRFEHTDGLNLVTLDAEYKRPVYTHPSKCFAVEWLLGAGGIWSVTRTDVRVFGDGLNNDFHVAGYALAGKTGLKFYFFKRLFLLAETKLGYATLPSVLIKNSAPEIADHNFLFWEKIGAVGFNFYLKKRRTRSPKGE